LTFELRVVAIRDDPARSTAPVIEFVGEMERGIARVKGSAMLMDDGNIHWSFVSTCIN
jgi:hypothetical protein